MTLVLNSGSDWQGIFRDIKLIDESGELIKYRVKELGVGGWTSSYSDNQEGIDLKTGDKITVTNTRTPPDQGKTSVGELPSAGGIGTTIF